jgi:hypothetical protein
VQLRGLCIYKSVTTNVHTFANYCTRANARPASAHRPQPSISSSSFHMLQILLSNLITIFEHLNQLKAHHSQTPMNSLYNTNFNPIAIMKFLTPTVLILTSAKAENLQSSEWGHIPTKRNLRVGRIRRNLSDMSISMSMPGESADDGGGV